MEVFTRMRKFVSLALAAVLLASSLTACGGSSASSAAQSTAPASSGGNSSSVSAAAAIGTASAPVDVKIIIKDVSPTEDDVKALAQNINDKMAAHGQYVNVIFEEPPASDYKTAVPLAVMNGEIDADLIYFQGGDLAVSQQGLLEDLTSYIEKSTYVKALMDDSNKAKLANYPYLLWLAPPRVSVPVIRDDWAQQLSSYKTLLSDPSADNYYAFFKELKDKGLCQYAISADGSIARLDSIFNQAFGVTATVVKDKDGNWVFSKATEAEKNKLAFYAKLYADGLLDPEFLTDTWDVMEQKFYDGKTAILAGTAGGVVQIYNNKMTQTNGEAAFLDVLSPASGVAQGYTVDVTKESRGFAINAESKNKDAAFAVLEFMASPEGRILDKVGIEGTHYNVTDNKIVFTDKFPEWWARFWDTTRNFDPQNPSLAAPVLSAPATASLESANKYLIQDTNILIPEDMAPQWDAMNNLYSEYSTDIIRGVKPISAFDEFVQKWNEAGGTDFTAVLKEKLG